MHLISHFIAVFRSYGAGGVQHAAEAFAHERGPGAERELPQELGQQRLIGPRQGE